MATSAPAKGQAAAPAGPFRKGTQPTSFSTGYNQTLAFTTATQDFPQWSLPTNNILRGIVLEVNCAVTSNSASVAFNTPDAPLNVFSTVNFTDNGGNSIVGSFDSYTLSVVQKYGGYAQSSDMRNSAVYSTTTGTGASGGSFNMVFRIPVEVVSRTGFGSLENTSSNSPLLLNLTLNSSTNVYSTAPTTLADAKVTVKGDLLGYWQGPPSSAAQAPNLFGSTQFWNRTNLQALSGAQNVTLPTLGLGNPIRTEVYLNYATGSSRSGADFPNPLTWQFRNNSLLQGYSQNLWQDEMSRIYGYSNATLDEANGLDTGVFVIPFDADFTFSPGNDSGNGYLSTNVGDPITLIGDWAASSTLYILRNYLVVKGAQSQAAAPAAPAAS